MGFDIAGGGGDSRFSESGDLGCISVNSIIRLNAWLSLLFIYLFIYFDFIETIPLLL